MTDTASPFRLIQPSQQLYDSDSGENTVLRNITPENIGGMYGLLLDRTAKARANQDRYNDILGSINKQQAQLAREKLAGDMLTEEMKFRLGLVDKGGMGVAPALSGLSLQGLRSPLTEEQASQSVLTTDGLQRALTAGKAYEAVGTGAQRAAEAGYTVDPGQALPATAQGILSSRLTSTAPMDVTLEGMRGRTELAKKSLEEGDGTTRADSTVDAGTGNVQVKFTNKSDPTAAINAGAAYESWARAMRRHLADPTRVAKPAPFVIPRGSTPLAQGAPTEGRPLTNQGTDPAAPQGTAAGAILNPAYRPTGPLARNIPPALAGDLPDAPRDNRRPPTGASSDSNVVATPPQRTGTKETPALTSDQLNKAKAAVAERGRITGYEWTPDTGHVALYARGKPLPLGQ